MTILNSDPGALVLGIESSCDETAAAIVVNGQQILSNVVTNQYKDHAPFGGIVPELASRRHLINFVSVIQTTLTKASLKINNLTGIAVTQGPGLIGALLIGLNLAKSLAWSQKIPIVGISHLEGHLAALNLTTKQAPPYPHITLLVSGGHTSIFLVHKPGCQEEIGHTTDDAAGEAYDKIAKLYGLGYPGGPIIERLATQSDSKTSIYFPRPRLYDGTLNFSFAGLKTAVINFREKHKRKTYRIENLCASFQEAVVEVLVKKTLIAAKKYNISHLALTGGVASNHRLREHMIQATNLAGLDLKLPPPELCTDNAAMIAAAGCYSLRAGHRLTLNADAISRLPRGGFLPK